METARHRQLLTQFQLSKQVTHTLSSSSTFIEYLSLLCKTEQLIAHMPYQNFEHKTRHCKIQGHHHKKALQSLDALSFLHDRPAIRRILNGICSSGSFSLCLFGIAGPTLRFNELAICYDMTHPLYLEVVSELY